eukprot:3946301-Lingulodinium_polyedra.AAC.1
MDPWADTDPRPAWEQQDFERIDPLLAPHAGSDMRLQCIEFGLGQVELHVHDPRTGVTWVCRPIRAYYAENGDRVGPAPDEGDDSTAEASSAEAEESPAYTGPERID